MRLSYHMIRTIILTTVVVVTLVLVALFCVVVVPRFFSYIVSSDPLLYTLYSKYYGEEKEQDVAICAFFCGNVSFTKLQPSIIVYLCLFLDKKCERKVCFWVPEKPLEENLR